MSDDREEKPAMRTTIVGGRPPGSGTDLGPIPRGLEILISKASVDPEFCKLLLDRRAEAARTIELDLTPAETQMIEKIPREHLEAIIANTEVPRESRKAFLEKTVEAMIITGIVGIIAAIGGPVLFRAKEKSRGIRARENLATVDNSTNGADNTSATLSSPGVSDDKETTTADRESTETR